MQQRRGQLLLVDGEVARAQKLAKRLEHLNFDIQIADNGATGLLKAHEIRPDVVVSAGSMPILDGYRMLEALRSQPLTRELPVILLTDDSTHEEVARGWMAGADLCIPRNQGEVDVLATLHRALNNLPVRERSSCELRLVS